MQILITLVATQTISTIIALTEFEKPEEIVVLSIELAGIAALLMLIRLDKPQLFQRLILLCQAVLIFALIPSSQFKFFTGAYQIIFRLVMPKSASQLLLVEWVVLILIIFVLGTEIAIAEIVRSSLVGIGLIILDLFIFQQQVSKNTKSPSIVVHSKVNYTLPNDGSNPKSSCDRMSDPQVASLYLDEQLNILGYNNSMSEVSKLTENDLPYLLDELVILKIDSRSKSKLQYKSSKQSLKALLELIRNQGTPITVLLLEYNHPQLKERMIKIIYAAEFEIQFHELKERDIFLKQRYVFVILKQLFKTLSHEFGTSLNYLLAIAQDAIDKNNHELLHYFQPIKSMGLIMHHFILDMVDYNDLKGKRFELQLEKIDIQELLDDVISIFSHTLHQKGILISYDLFLSEKTILTDGRRLKQILINLISNSQKFTYKGGINITVKALELNQYIQFEVNDTGIGMTTAELEALSAMLKYDYKEEQKISKNTAGFGLGCYLCNKIAQALGDLHYENGGGLRYFSPASEKGTKVVFKIKNTQFNLTYTVNAISDNSSGILKIGKNTVIDLRQSQIELGLSAFKKPLTRNFSTMMVQKVKSFHDGQLKDIFANPQQTREVLFGFPIKDSIIGLQSKNTISGFQTFAIQETVKEQINGQDTINEETTENEYLQRLQIQNIKYKYVPSDIIQELKQSSIQVSEPYVQNCSCKSILIVDDEMVNILGLSIILKSFNLEADSAFNGQDAISKLENSHCLYNVIFMDINMPIMDGFSATKKIKEIYKLSAPKIIACTAFTDSETKQKCYDIGMSNYLSKPIDKQELQKLLSYLMI